MKGKKLHAVRHCLLVSSNPSGLSFSLHEEREKRRRERDSCFLPVCVYRDCEEDEEWGSRLVSSSSSSSSSLLSLSFSVS